MTDTLDNGIKLPSRGSRDWYSDASSNAHLIDEHLGDTDVHLTDDDRTAISSISSKANSSDVYTKTEIDTSLSSKANASDLTTHTSNSDIHVTSTDKSTWNGKQGALSTAQLNACNSGITSTKVSSYDTHVANSDVHVTTSDKSTWNAKQNALTDTQLSACNSGITSDKVSQYDRYASSFLPLSGGALTGQRISRSVDNSSLILLGSTSMSNGAYIELNGKDVSNNGGNFYVRAQDGTNAKYLIGKPSGSLSWGGTEFTCTNGNLGTSSNKWKTINGINPGALSLPETTPTVTIDTANWDWNGGRNTFTMPCDGWLNIALSTSNDDHYIAITVDGASRATSRRVYDNTIVIYIPVRANSYVSALTVCGGIVGNVRCYKCQGNV